MIVRTLALCLTILLASCSGPEPAPPDRDGDGTSDTVERVRVERDTVWLHDTSAATGAPAAAGGPAGELIVPGVRIAHVRIGGSLDSANRILGRPDSGDAGMGHVMAFWFSRPGSGKRSVLTVYASLDTAARFHQIRWVRVTSPRFATKEGLAVGSPLDSIRDVFPRVRPSVEYDEGGKTYTIYDDVRSGIAFDVEKLPSGAAARSVAVTVHELGRPVADSYLPMHDYRRLGSRAQR